MKLIELDCSGNLLRLCIKHGSQIEIIPLQDIMYCQASGNYSIIFLNNNEQLFSSTSLTTILNQLKNHG